MTGNYIIGSWWTKTSSISFIFWSKWTGKTIYYEFIIWILKLGVTTTVVQGIFSDTYERWADFERLGIPARYYLRQTFLFQPFLIHISSNIKLSIVQNLVTGRCNLFYSLTFTLKKILQFYSHNTRLTSHVIIWLSKFPV